jgi:hypothetical protein
MCYVLGAAEAVATANCAVKNDWLGFAEFSFATLALFAVGRYATNASESAVQKLSLAIAGSFHAVYLVLLIGSNLGFLTWDQLRQGITPLTMYAATQTVMEFLLPPYFFTQVRPQAFKRTHCTSHSIQLCIVQVCVKLAQQLHPSVCLQERAALLVCLLYYAHCFGATGHVCAACEHSDQLGCAQGRWRHCE